MSYTLKKITDTHPEWLKALKEKCYGVIGAGAVVTKDVPAYSVAVGAPAKVIRTFGE